MNQIRSITQFQTATASFVACSIFCMGISWGGRVSAAESASPAPSPATSKPAVSGSGAIISGGAGLTGSVDGSVEPVEKAGSLAKIGDTELGVDEIKTYLSRLERNEREKIVSNPRLLVQAVNLLLVQKILLKEALEKHWDENPELVAHLQQVREVNIVDSFVESQVMPDDGYPSADELNKAYEAKKDKLSVPHQFQISQIFIAMPVSPDKAALKKAQDKLDEVNKKLSQPNADFSQIARDESEDKASAAQGGMMGWVSTAKMPPKIKATVMNLPKGTVSNPVRLTDGLHILKVLDTKEMSPLTLDEVKPMLVQALREERTQANKDAYLGKLLKQNPINIDDAALIKAFNAASPQK